MFETQRVKPMIIEDDDQELVISAGKKDATPPDPTKAATHQIPEIAAVLPIRNVVIFPGTVAPLTIERDKSRRLLEDVLPNQKVIIAVCQKDQSVDDPTPADLYRVGSAVMVLKLLRMEEGGQSVIVHGMVRVRIEEWLQTEPYLQARIKVLPQLESHSTETEALVASAKNLARRVIELSPNIPDEATAVLNSIEQAGPMADFLAANLPVDVPTRQTLLEELDVNERLRRTARELQHQVEVLELSDKIQGQIKSSMEKSHREYYLHEQLKAIQKELGQSDERAMEIERLRNKIAEVKMPKGVEAEALKELSRLEKMHPSSPEHNVIRTYMDVMTELPWSKSTVDNMDINRASRILDADHYGLHKVKKRILEYLAVRRLAPESHGPILCFAGPPGVGKTSLGQSIARALGRNFIRMSLGGVHDEAELRGHRRTYIGAMPGRVIQEMRKAGSNNPVFMLDELDKVGADFRGDPTSALLEILDPAQNNTFQDHYLNVPFDLSKVLFIATVNYMGNVPPPLRDRMEIIDLPGYTSREKLAIAERYLVARQMKENGLAEGQIEWPDSALMTVICDYTREAGVRELGRQIGAVCRSIAAAKARGGKSGKVTVSQNTIVTALGPTKYESELALRTSVPGVATGLAYTPVGGEIIFIEATKYAGHGAFCLTGQIGDVMRESAQAAFSLIKSRSREMGIKDEDFKKYDFHVHVPAGGIPKDGPSAGVAMFTSIASLLTGVSVRHDVAMTGEITLRGLVLPIGGVKEKVLAAKQAGIKMVILPQRNKKDLTDIPSDARKEMKFIFASKVEQVLAAALAKKPTPRKNGGAKKSKAGKPSAKKKQKATPATKAKHKKGKRK